MQTNSYMIGKFRFHVGFINFIKILKKTVTYSSKYAKFQGT